MTALRLTDSQRSALELLADRTGDDRPWIGAAEGVSGTTLEALERRRLAYVKWTDTPYRRLVGRITPYGRDAVTDIRRRRAASELELEHAELDVLEGIVRTAEAGDRPAALATLERLRSVAT